MKPLLSVLHASRGRPEMALGTMAQYRDRASQKWPIEYIFSFDSDDKTQREVIDAVVKTQFPDWFRVHCISGMPNNNTAAWNRAWAASSGKLLFESSDDFEPPDRWDEQCVDASGGVDALDRPFVLGVSDVHGTFSAPLTGSGGQEYYVATAAYCRRSGYFLFPEYLTFGVYDIDQKAIIEDSFVNAFHVRFLHHWHGSQNDPLCDDTYRRAHLYLGKEFKKERKRIDEDRRWCGYLDIRLDADPHRMFNPHTEFLAPPCMPWHEQCSIFERRKAGGWAHSRNVLPANPEDGRHFYFQGEYGLAYDRFARLLDYYSKYCDGRMRVMGIQHLVDVCKEHRR